MDSERLRNKGVSKVNTWISLGRGNRIDVVGGLGEGGNGNRRNPARWDGRRKYWERWLELEAFGGDVVETPWHL